MLNDYVDKVIAGTKALILQEGYVDYERVNLSTFVQVYLFSASVQ
jgi:hypothetical protein